MKKYFVALRFSSVIRVQVEARNKKHAIFKGEKKINQMWDYTFNKHIIQNLEPENFYVNGIIVRDKDGKR